MQITFDRMYYGEAITLDVEASDSIDTVLAKIAEITGSPAEQFHLYAMADKWTDLKPGFTLSAYNIREGHMVHLMQEFDITLVMMDATTFTLGVEAADDIGFVREMLEDCTGIDTRYINLVVGTTLMDDYEKYVLDYGLKQDSLVHLVKVAPPGAAA